MITQEFKQGKNDIKIEVAESIDDAVKNSFPEGVYNKIYVNGEAVSNYMSLIQFIVAETKKNKTKLVPAGKDLSILRKEMIDNQNKQVKAQINDLKKKYQDIGVPDEALKELDNMIDKIDMTGVRVVE